MLSPKSSGDQSKPRFTLYNNKNIDGNRTRAATILMGYPAFPKSLINNNNNSDNNGSETTSSAAAPSSTTPQASARSNSHSNSNSNSNRIDIDIDIDPDRDIDDLLATVFASVSRRRQELVDDEKQVPISNRYLSDELAKVPGLKSYLEHRRTVKSSYSRQEVVDEWSHGTVTRAELHQRYTNNF